MASAKEITLSAISNSRIEIPESAFSDELSIGSEVRKFENWIK